MKVNLTAAVLAASLVAALAASTAGAAAPKKTVFKGAYAGAAVVVVDDATKVADIKADGKGAGNVIGAGKLVGLGKGDASAQPCVPFTGTGTITGTAGTKLVFKMSPGASGCGDEAGDIFAVNGRATVTLGTGKFAKAKGTLKITGTYDNNAGTFSVKVNGTLIQ